MKISLLEAVNEVIDLATNSLDNIVKVQYITSVDDIDIQKAKDWPALFIIVDSAAQLLENENQTVLSLYVLDASTAREDEYLKDLNIKSDLLQEMSKLLDLLQLNQLISTINTSAQPFSGRFNNGLSGWSANVSVNIKKPCYND